MKFRIWKMPTGSSRLQMLTKAKSIRKEGYQARVKKNPLRIEYRRK